MPWLFKAEPETRIVNGVDVKYSIDDMEKDKITGWEGVRNAEARNLMLKMKVGDKGLFYRSNTKVPGVCGVIRVCREAYEDDTATDPKHPYYDRRAASKENKWKRVDVEYVAHCRLVSLHEMRANPKLSDMALLKRSRLSVSYVTDDELEIVLRMAGSSTKEMFPGPSDKGIAS